MLAHGVPMCLLYGSLGTEMGASPPPASLVKEPFELWAARRPTLCPVPGCGSATPRGASCTSHMGSAESLTPVATGLSITAGSAPVALRLGSSWTLQPMNSVWIWRLAAGNPSHRKL